MGFLEGLSGLLDHTRDAVLVVDSDGTVEFVSETSQQLVGYDPATLRGESVFEYVHPEDCDSLREAIERVRESDADRTETVTYRHRTGEASWMWLEGCVSTYTAGTGEKYVLTGRDITPRMTARQERQRTEAHLLELAQTVNDVLWLFDGEWDELLFINGAYEEIYGASGSALRSNPRGFLETIHPDDVPEVEAAMERVAGGETAEIEFRVNPTRDYGIWVLVRANPIIEDGEVVRIAGYTRDVTDRRRRKRHLVVMEHLLRHNLRNDATAILGNLDVIGDAVDDSLAPHVETIESAVVDLLDSADKQREIITLLTNPGITRQFDLVTTVDSELTALQSDLPETTIETSFPESADVVALPRIGLAARELIENADEHAAVDSPSVTVSIDCHDDWVELHVQDDCPPIPDEEVDILVGDREMNEIYHTTGLGLWLVYWLVDLSRGSVEFSASETDGNTVTLLLPRPA